MTRFRAEIDPEVCVGAQMCVSLAPDHYTYDADAGISRASPEASEDEGVLDAAETCPVGAITVWDADTGEELAG